ncbi:MAG: hypothetical protein MJA83_03995, partial [Gammaproteobacteria bacterium]|nr:hypothetical protein [Gammaproteobacteria bacterium]
AGARQIDGMPIFFVIGTDNRLWFKKQQDDNQQWGGWHKGDTSQKIYSITTITQQDGRITVFATNKKGRSFYCRQKDANSAVGSWIALSGGITHQCAAKNQDGCIELIGIGGDAAIWSRRQKAPNSDSWTGWAKLYKEKYKDLALLSNAAGQPMMFALNKSSNLVYSVKQSNSWSSLTNLKGYCRQLHAELDESGCVNVYVTGGDYSIWRRKQKSPNGNEWEEWKKLEEQ